VLDHGPFSFITNNDVPHRLSPGPESERAGAGRWSARRKTAVILERLRGADLESTSQFTNPAKPRSANLVSDRGELASDLEGRIANSPHLLQLLHQAQVDYF